MPAKRGKPTAKKSTSKGGQYGVPTGKSPTSMPIRQLPPMMPQGQRGPAPPSNVGVMSPVGDPGASLQAAIGANMRRK